MQRLGRWWNGVWGRMGRRDIWLTASTTYRVTAREGDPETGVVRAWEFASEDEATMMVDRLQRARDAGKWRPITPTSAGRPPEQT